MREGKSACLFLVVFKWARVFSVSVFEFRKVVFEKGEYLFACAEFGVLDEGIAMRDWMSLERAFPFICFWVLLAQSLKTR